MDAFETYDRAAATVTDRVKKAVVDFFPYLLVLANIVFMVMNTLFSVGLQNPFNEDVISKTIINCATSSLAFACFVTYGDRRTKNTLAAYQINVREWGKASDRIRRGPHFEAFLEYCKRAVEIEREEKRLAIVTNRTRVSVSDYNAKYRNFSSKELNSEVKAGRITRREARILRVANGNIRVRPINPLLLLCGTHAENLNDAGRAEDASALKSILGKPITVILSSVLVASIHVVYGGITITTVYNMITYTFLILISSFLGYEKGASNARKTNEAVLNRIVFLERFEKSIKETPPTI